MRILVADDNPLVRKALRRALEVHEGWSVCCEAQDGLDAIEQAKQCKPDLVLIDLMMPHMNGLDAASKISQFLPGVPIIMSTLYDSPQLRAEAKNHGVLQVISKSESNLLIAAIEILAHTMYPSNTVHAEASPPLLGGGRRI